MADIVFRYPEMNKAAEDIRALAGRYRAAASNLESEFMAAINGWEGESREAVQAFVSGKVMEYTRESVPRLLEGLAEMLDANAKQMANADHEIAENIPK